MRRELKLAQEQIQILHDKTILNERQLEKSRAKSSVSNQEVLKSMMIEREKLLNIIDDLKKEIGSMSRRNRARNESHDLAGENTRSRVSFVQLIKRKTLLVDQIPKELGHATQGIHPIEGNTKKKQIKRT